MIVVLKNGKIHQTAKGTRVMFSPGPHPNPRVGFVDEATNEPLSFYANEVLEIGNSPKKVKKS